ncbi:hypothetical protein NMY22_g9432 [Coprinellus aureogranulatus]|nr:hypothetical protein NMY22_g9432 [Coprinellus aureogranulatus]
MDSGQSKAFQTPAPVSGRKRAWTPASSLSVRPHKKRRTSEVAFDSPSGSSPVFQCENASTTSVSGASSGGEQGKLKVQKLDRFIPLRPQTVVPLTISPRTNRMYKTFGMLSDKRLSYKDENIDPASHSKAFNLLRKSAATLFPGTKSSNGLSVTNNLGKTKQPSRILDSPGLTTALYSSPLSWSANNRIAVACGRDVYYQDLSTGKVTHFFTAGTRQPAKEAISILWGDQKHENKLACITDNGACELFDVESPMATLLHEPKISATLEVAAKSMCWSGDSLAYGLSNGEIRVRDVRSLSHYWSIGDRGHPFRNSDSVTGHRKTVISLAYDSTGNYLASGDVDGNVHIWDIRKRKTLTAVKRSSKIKHKAPVKALAWCSWKSDLLATGGYYPEGVVRFWSTNKLNQGPLEPEKTLTLNAAVHSLIWAPHCKEILSVHGVQFQEEASTHRRRQSTEPGAIVATPSTTTLSASERRSKPTIVPGPLTHSLVVHDFPSAKRLFTLTKAHRHSISTACLGPNGQDVFTASPKEQAIRMWQVWGEPPKAVKETPFSSCTIR